MHWQKSDDNRYYRFPNAKTDKNIVKVVQTQTVSVWKTHSWTQAPDTEAQSAWWRSLWHPHSAAHSWRMRYRSIEIKLAGTRRVSLRSSAPSSAETPWYSPVSASHLTVSAWSQSILFNPLLTESLTIFLHRHCYTELRCCGKQFYMFQMLCIEIEWCTCTTQCYLFGRILIAPREAKCFRSGRVAGKLLHTRWDKSWRASLPFLWFRNQSVSHVFLRQNALHSMSARPGCSQSSN